MAKQKVLVVEDDRDLREALCLTLDVAGYPYEEAASGEIALDILKDTPIDMVISDVNMSGIDGHELLKRIKANHPGLPVALMTAYGDIERAINAVRNGAADYLVKPFESETLLDLVKSTLGNQTPMSGTNLPVAEEQSSIDLLSLAKRVAESDSTVLISGESGTGKEVLARYIHDNSLRADQPFIAINCAAIPENMLEAILFGHEKGAYTGAINGAPGKFEQANGGTILLDEISEMEIGLQAKLLRVLQEREVERLGGRKTIKLDVRVIATTNRDLREYVQEGKFREDLYYRLSVFPLQWKPLRERPKDIVPLAKRLLKKHGKKMGKGSLKIDSSAVHMLTQYNWPGNVRELDNAVQRALVLQQGNVVSAEDFRLEMSPPVVSMASYMKPQQPVQPNVPNMAEMGAVSQGEIGNYEKHGIMESSAPATSTMHALDSSPEASLGDDLKQREFQVILNTLRSVNGSRKQTSEILGISPRTLRYKLAKMRESGLDVDELLAAS
ncbi:sigma-54-dependent transcriptional regulator [Litoribrevibacter albus]|uniref:Sigma-54-dependent Fis family transcriptional regulator n=1 Tax=Litoribrevibacter albus TaxID=1473156 RepID=A0AA37SAR3_9GAMM|nr:sigma-54 dependent transcriptional regulator [Litoribrevibacter albus]GLQ32325.1 sigma-54-dependent Fis family transcriptional regulator [Litoribrevibacter albus]